jgi:hypothetical protein
MTPCTVLAGAHSPLGKNFEQGVHGLTEFDGDVSHLSLFVIADPMCCAVDPLSLGVDYSVVATRTAHATTALVLTRCVVERIDAPAGEGILHRPGA